MLEEFAQVFRCRAALGDKMVVIRKDRPCFELPLVMLCENEQLSFKQVKLCRCLETWNAEIGRCGDKVCPSLVQPMQRRMRPVFGVRRLIGALGARDSSRGAGIGLRAHTGA